MKTVPSAIALAFTLWGCASQKPAFPQEYESVRIARHEGSLRQFCVTSGMLLDGWVSFESSFLEGTFAVPRYGGPPEIPDDACLVLEDECLVEGDFGRIQLGDEQLDKVRALVADVPEKECEAVKGLTCDSCRATTITVGDTSVNDSCCGEINEDFSVAFRALESYLDELATSVKWLPR